MQIAEITDAWLRDLPQQFQDKHNIEVLISAFGRQLQEIQQVFDSMNSKLDLDTAVGQNLDYVGTIIPLSRKEAGELAGIQEEPVISDERYRQFLRYKNLVNTSECTYYDLILGMELLWDLDKVHYMEDPDYPATILFETDEMDLDGKERIEFRADLCIRSSGVGIILRKQYTDSFTLDPWFGNMELHICFSTYLKNAYLYLDGNWRPDGTYFLDGNIEKIAADYLKSELQMFIGISQDVEVNGALKVEKDLWYLDGTYLCDGERKLDAEIMDFGMI